MTGAMTEAIRHPKRGRAHREAALEIWWPRHTVCGLPTRNMTERVDIETVAPEDRCRRCWR